MKNISNYLTYLPKQILPLIAIALAVIIPAVVMAGYSPADRQTFTHDAPADYVTFNSIVDNPEYGDERAFLDVKKYVDGNTSSEDASYANSGGFKDSVQVESGDVYMVRAYVHNNASVHLNTSGEGIAKNTQFRALIPTGEATFMRNTGYVSADNATPKTVADTVDFYSSSPFSMSLVPNSATFFTASQPNGMDVSDSFASSGAKLGQNKLDGNFPGCFESAGVLVYFVQIDKSDFEVDKQVRFEGQTKSDWKDSITAQPGDTVEYRLEWENTGSSQINDVSIRDSLPANQTLVSGSTTIYNANNPSGVNAGTDGVIKNGINVGDYTAGSNVIVSFKAKIDSAKELECGTTNMVNTMYGKVGKIVESDKATVKVSKKCDTPKDPVYSCDSLQANPSTLMAGQSVNFTTNASASNGASITGYDYSFGDGNSASNGANTSHTYNSPGSYTASVDVTFDVNGKTKTDGQGCSVKVKVKDIPEDPVYSCDALAANTLSINSGDSVTFTTSSTAAGGATVTSHDYDFGDGESANGGNSISHTYSTAGNYTAQVTVNFNVDGQSKSDTGANCKVNITVEDEPEPIYQCVALAATPLSRTTYRLSATANAENGATVSRYIFLFGDGDTQVIDTNSEIATSADHVYAPGSYTAKVSVVFTVDGQEVTSTHSGCETPIRVEEVVTPTYKCDVLDASTNLLTLGESVEYSARATVTNGATITKYTFDFGDGASEDVVPTGGDAAVVSHTYNSAGTFATTVTVSFMVDGQIVTDTSARCAETVTVDEEPETPVYECTGVESVLDDRTISLDVSTFVAGGASVNSFAYDFDDGSEVFKTSSNQVSHEYAEAGNYNVNVVVTFDVADGQQVDESCGVNVKIVEDPVCKYNSDLKPNDPNCVPVCEHDSSLLANDPNCGIKPPVKELPNTGASGLMVFFGTGALGTAVRSWMVSRRTLRDSLLGL